jgi:outer membrane protein OmpA-like peptidoglycan-associated protein
VNFDFDKATLRPDADPALNQVLALMKDEPKLALEIGGHTDDVGKPDYNLKLSDERAAAVLKWIEAHGIAASRLSSHGLQVAATLSPALSQGRG